MKLLPAAFLACLTATFSLSLRAEVEKEIPIGLEAVTGIRSDYVYRGFGLAGPLMDFQAEGELVVRDDLSLNFGGWFASEISDDYSEGSAFLDLRYDLSEQFTAGATWSYREYDHSFFESGFDGGAFLTWYGSDSWDVTAGVYRDFGADAWYAHLESGWSHRLSDDAFFGISGGFSAVDSYYERSGLNDFYGRASLTYNVNNTISLTPFVGWSLEIEDGDGDGDEMFGGLWFEVSF